MNLSIIEKMVREGDLSRDGLRYLLDCKGECEWLDYKESLSIENEKELCDFGRDALALKNVGGGYIVIGVKDKTWEPIGSKGKLPYDTKALRDKLRKCLGLELEVDIVHHDQLIHGENRIFSIVYVRASRKRRKRRSPTLAQIDFCASKPFGIRRGDIFARRGDSTVKVTSQTELEDLLDSLEEVADHHQLIADLPPSPFAIKTGLVRLLEQGFNRFIGRSDLKRMLLDAITMDPRLWIINVHGPGGVGKSALVNWATYELYRADEYESIIQLTAKETVLTEKGIIPYSRTLYSLENLLDHILNVFEEPFIDDLEKKKKVATDILCAWKTLLVLDNMETISDGRIINFAQSLPIDNKSKVLLTSRVKTGGWEFPIQVSEFDIEEVKEFVALTSKNLCVDFPTDEKMLHRVAEVTGRLPLAIQWMLAQYKTTGDITRTLKKVSEKDSPVLEFSFRNIWTMLSSEARAVLAILTIFEAPPTSQLIQIASEHNIDIVQRALRELEDVTLVSSYTNPQDGSTIYIALPITLSFARHQLSGMGEFELRSRQRLQQYTQQMSLQESEIRRFSSEFQRFGISSNNERRAVILCKRAESDAFAGRSDNASLLFRQATDLAPESAYVHAMRASFELTQNHIGLALEAIEEACRRCTKKTGALCFTIKAQILDAQHNKRGKVDALKKAIEYAPEDVILQHQYGVALSRAGLTKMASEVFSEIVENEIKSKSISPTLIMALGTRALNLWRLGNRDNAIKDIQRAESLILENPRFQHMTSRLQDIKEEIGI